MEPVVFHVTPSSKTPIKVDTDNGFSIILDFKTPPSHPLVLSLRIINNQDTGDSISPQEFEQFMEHLKSCNSQNYNAPPCFRECEEKT